jgi:crotonobetainyl-CoA:carnitine CoA-transferase CaiB-like acyl-CoA transferase
LRGVRILDLTTVVMGPAGTQILGDLGADVIKVEAPSGDSLRWIGPAHHASMGPLFLQANRNKRGVVLDLKNGEDKAVLHALIRDADVLVYNIRPQAMERLGLSYDEVAGLNPGIIYCGAVGYGRDGPDAGKGVYDDLMQAASGIAWLFQAVDGKPRYAPINICDRVVGLYMTVSILAALYHRNLTGEGQEIEVPMFETMAQFVLGDHMGGRAVSPPIGDMGYLRLLSRFRGPYPTRDGYLSLVVYSDKHWQAFTEFVGDPGLLERDERFRNQEMRTRHSEDMGRYLAGQMPKYTTKEWISFCNRIDIPVAPVNSLEDLFSDPHLSAVGMFSQREHPTEGTVNVPRFPVSFSKTPGTVRKLAPNLGEHTAEIKMAVATMAGSSSGGEEGSPQGEKG